MPEKTIAQKLLIKPGQQVRFINPPVDLPALLGSLPDGTRIFDESADAGTLVPSDVIVLFAHNRTELVTLLPGLRGAVSPDSKVWIAYHKGTSPIKTDINRDSINAYAHTLGMEGIAMISVDEDWSALRLRMAR